MSWCVSRKHSRNAKYEKYIAGLRVYNVSSFLNVTQIRSDRFWKVTFFIRVWKFGLTSRPHDWQLASPAGTLVWGKPTVNILIPL